MNELNLDSIVLKAMRSVCKMLIQGYLFYLEVFLCNKIRFPLHFLFHFNFPPQFTFLKINPDKNAKNFPFFQRHFGLHFNAILRILRNTLRILNAIFN